MQVPSAHPPSCGCGWWWWGCAIKIRNAKTSGRRSDWRYVRHTRSTTTLATPVALWPLQIVYRTGASQPVFLETRKTSSRRLGLICGRSVGVSAAVDAARDRVEGSESCKMLTFDLERTPLEPSIQTYSAMTAPFWGRSRYFLS